MPESASSKASSSKTAKAAAQEVENNEDQDAIALLTADHRRVEELFSQYENATRRAQKSKLAMQICQELIIHTLLEEEIFYPACRDHMDDDKLDEAQVEHDSAKTLISEIMAGSPQDHFYDAKVSVLAEQIRHHVKEEEARNEGVFAKAKSGGVDVDELAEQLRTRKEELQELAKKGGLPQPKPLSFDLAKMADRAEQARGEAARDARQSKERDSQGAGQRGQQSGRRAREEDEQDEQRPRRASRTRDEGQSERSRDDRGARDEDRRYYGEAGRSSGERGAYARRTSEGEYGESGYGGYGEGRYADSGASRRRGQEDRDYEMFDEPRGRTGYRDEDENDDYGYRARGRRDFDEDEDEGGYATRNGDGGGSRGGQQSRARGQSAQGYRERR